MSGKNLMIKCSNCHDWFNLEGLLSMPIELLTNPGITLENIEVKCPHCNKATTFNKSDIKGL